MKSLFKPNDLQGILQRIEQIQPNTPRRWGRMSPHGMICHLADAYRAAMGAKPVEPVDTLYSRTLMRFVGLSVPMRWPKGIKTLPDVDQEIGGTPPEDFERDREQLIVLVRRFAAARGEGMGKHAIFGALSRSEWGRWGWRHPDHHLRQFGL